MTLEKIAAQMPGRAHFDAYRFGFIRTRNNATIVIGEHDQRLFAQIGLKNALARRIGIVAVHKRGYPHTRQPLNGRGEIFASISRDKAQEKVSAQR